MKKHQRLVSLTMSLMTAGLTCASAVAQDQDVKGATEMSQSDSASGAGSGSEKTAPSEQPAAGAGSASTPTDSTAPTAKQPPVSTKEHVEQVPSTSIAPPLPIDAGAAKNAAAAPGADPTSSGPLLEKRLALREKILWAKKQGIGISAYQAEMTRIDQAAMSGAPVDELQQRIDHLSSGIDEQFERSQILKTQRPAEASSGMAGDLPPPSQGGDPSSLGGLSTDRIMKALKQRFGDQLPNIDPATRDRLLNSDQAKQLLKKFKSAGN